MSHHSVACPLDGKFSVHRPWSGRLPCAAELANNDATTPAAASPLFQRTSAIAVGCSAPDTLDLHHECSPTSGESSRRLRGDRCVTESAFLCRVPVPERVDGRGGRAGEVRDRHADAPHRGPPLGARAAQEDLPDGDDAGGRGQHVRPGRAPRRSLPERRRPARVDRLERNLRPPARQVRRL